MYAKPRENEISELTNRGLQIEDGIHLDSLHVYCPAT